VVSPTPLPQDSGSQSFSEVGPHYPPNARSCQAGIIEERINSDVVDIDNNIKEKLPKKSDSCSADKNSFCLTEDFMQELLS
jgi:hypothetical protein